MATSKPRWFALYSRTGTELRSIVTALGRKPDVVLTTNPDDISTRNVTRRQLHEGIEWELLHVLRPGDIVTLHGYLFILSPELVNTTGAKFYNGHPGLITMYPELKGKDPQKRAMQGRYPIAGCVLHEVVEEVDAGRILMTVQTPVSQLISEDELCHRLRLLSIDMWVTFLKGVL